MKKLLIFGFVLGLVASNLMLVKPVHAISVHDHPWCNWFFWEDHYCSPKDDDPSPVPAPALNQAPVWTTSQTGFSVKTGNLLQFTVSATDPDNDPIFYSVSFLPIGASFNSSTKTFSWTPSNDQVGNYLIQFSVTDGKTTIYQGITVAVSQNIQANQKPNWDYINTKTAYVGQLLQFAVSASDPENDSVSYSAINLPNDAEFESSSRIFSWTPAKNQIGTHVVTFRAFDGYNNSDTNVTINVTVPNGKPYFVSFNPPSKGQVNKLYTYAIHGADPDNDPLTYSLAIAPTGMNINSVTGLIQWTPNALQTNFSNVVVAISDGKDTTTGSFFIFVEPENAPIVAPAAPRINPSEPKIVISNIKVENDNGEIIAGWTTNIPSRGRVIYDTVSQSQKTKDFTYANATPDLKTYSTEHRINLGELEVGKIYYLRAVAKTDSQVVASNEMVFIQLEGGEVKSFFGASLFNIFGSLLTNTTFLWLVIIALSVYLFFVYRKIQKNSSPL